MNALMKSVILGKKKTKKILVAQFAVRSWGVWALGQSLLACFSCTD